MSCILFEFFMLYCSPTLLDSMLIQNILPIINNDSFSLEYLQNIKEDELAEMIKSVGITHKCAKDFKIAIDQIAKEFGGKIPGTEKELWDIHGVGQKIISIDFGRGIQQGWCKFIRNTYFCL